MTCYEPFLHPDHSVASKNDGMKFTILRVIPDPKAFLVTASKASFTSDMAKLCIATAVCVVSSSALRCNLPVLTVRRGPYGGVCPAT